MDRKSTTTSNIALHRAQSTISRVDDELIQKSNHDLLNTTDPIERLRLQCLSRGASGIVAIGRVFRRMYDGKKYLNKEELFQGIKETGLEISRAEADEMFKEFDKNNSGSINLDEFLLRIRPHMSEARRATVEQAFLKLDKSGDGFITINDIRGVYAATAHPRYMSGEESADAILHQFLANFESDGSHSHEGKITLEDIMNYYSAISTSIDSDCYFDLMMRKAYKL